MEADKCQRSTNVPCCGILAMRTVLEKLPQKILRSARPHPCNLGPTDFRIRQYLQNRSCRNVIELVILLRCPMPIVNVRLVPHLPKPCIHSSVAISLMQMLRPREDQRAPFCVVLWWVAPPGKHRTIRK